MIPDRFATQRLSVSDWRPEIADQRLRRTLEVDLTKVLTPAVLKPLPPSMQLEGQLEGVTAWIDARHAESDVLLVRQQQDNQLIGLMILARSPDAMDSLTIHIGYLFAESAWGFGYATELLNGFVAACSFDQTLRLVAGVEHDNPASARVLQKTGFMLLPEQSSESTEMYFRDIV
ncbi:GNAT family N-acetyltransferase [Ruegeria lacuscaerulensis]|uniref:GNAT family N-acetyltransferase n=1 Tax=Ruegeria lacuscaerulensis TaxID=55218 RepID=UPI00147D65A0|nr:GNAT family N-acetyltransferase [Ruegeria lacuscaerulensis]